MPLRLVGKERTLLYGLTLVDGNEGDSDEHQHVELDLPGGLQGRMTIHTLRGTREEIKKRLLESIDAFFDVMS